MSFNFSFAQNAQENLKGIDIEIEKIITDYKAVGISVAIVKDDKIIYSKGYGFRDLENKLVVTPNTIFGIGSNTKSFTSALIGILVQIGKTEANYRYFINGIELQQ